MYRSLDIVRVIKSRRLRWPSLVARMEECRSSFKILTSKSAEKRPLGSPRIGWEDTISMDLKEIGINTRNWLDLAQIIDYWRALMNGAFDILDSIIHGVG